MCKVLSSVLHVVAKAMEVILVLSDNGRISWFI